MKRSLVLCWALFFGCGPDQGRSTVTRPIDGGADFSGFGATCTHPPKDTDGDGISDKDEGAMENPPRDTDKDGIPDYKDQDSDNDGIPDAIEGRNGNPCTPPVDSDSDGKPDFRDLDSDDANDATVPDKEEAGADPLHPVDTNHDGRPDYMDLDNDGDGILDVFELTPQGQSVAVTKLADAPDTDGDGVPDFRDTDSDNDTILDGEDGSVDTDGDLIPNYRDTDSDGDCVPDSAEAGDSDPNTPPMDWDKDGAPDFEDIDSDNDGLVDGKEDKNCNGILDPCETDRDNPDTDGDTVSDLIEYEDCAIKPAAQQMACMCDGADASKSPLTRGDFVFTSDYMVNPSPAQETLNLTTNVSRADVVYDLDVTASMGVCATDLANNLAGTVLPGVRAKVRDIAFGLVTFQDFQDTFVVRYNHRLETTQNMVGTTNPALMSITAALKAVTSGDGYDLPEAGWEALYSIAAGSMLPVISISGPSITTWTSKLTPLAPATPFAGEETGTLGGVGFRTASVPIIVAVSDASWHDRPGTAASGEDGIADYAPGTDCPTDQDPNCNNVPSRETAISAANALGAHVIGLAPTNGSGDPKSRFIALAQATAAVVSPADIGTTRPANCDPTQCCTGLDGAGEMPIAGQCPLAYTINRQSLPTGTVCPVSSSVVTGIAALANALTFDVHVVASDVDPGTVDNFIDKLVPNVSGTGPAAMCVVVDMSRLQDNFIGPKAMPKPASGPGDGVLDTFLNISTNVQVCFDVVAKENTNVANTDQPQIFRAQLQVVGKAGSNSFNLGTPRQVFFLVPPVIHNGPIS
jgi:hypothetical protein